MKMMYHVPCLVLISRDENKGSNKVALMSCKIWENIHLELNSILCVLIYGQFFPKLKKVKSQIDTDTEMLNIEM